MLVETKHGKYHVDMDDCHIRNHLMGGHIFEQDIVEFLNQNIMPRCKYVADIGANIGCHSVSYGIHKKDLNIFAFEPQKKLYDLLKSNITENDLDDIVKVYDYGLAHKEYTCTLHSIDSVLDEKCGGWNKAGLGIGKGGEEIKLKTLDSMNLPGLDFMKIDVEGAEGLVIMGARETIKKYHPIIMFEHNAQRVDPVDAGLDHVPSPFEELVKLGYRHFEYLNAENYITFI